MSLSIIHPSNPSFPDGTEYPNFYKKEIFISNSKEIEPQAVFSLTGRVIYIVASILTFGLLPYVIYKISRYIAEKVLPSLTVLETEKAEYRDRKQIFIKSQHDVVQEFDIQMQCGAVVNGMALFQNKEAKEDFNEKNAADQKWIIRFKGNRGFYESNLLGYQCLGQNLKSNVLVFNYRGVADSKGFPSTPEQLISDGEACVQYLLSKGIKEENILIHGTSLGGALGTHVASLYEKIALINERSFGSLTAEAYAVIKKANELALQEERLDLPMAKFLVQYGLEFLASRLFFISGWEIDSVSAYEKIKAKKLIIYHKQDAIIPYHDASLYRMLKESIKEKMDEAVEEVVNEDRTVRRLKPEYKPLRVKMRRDFRGISVDAHIYSLESDKAYPEIKKFIHCFFNRSLC